MYNPDSKKLGKCVPAKCETYDGIKDITTWLRNTSLAQCQTKHILRSALQPGSTPGYTNDLPAEWAERAESHHKHKMKEHWSSVKSRGITLKSTSSGKQTREQHFERSVCACFTSDRRSVVKWPFIQVCCKDPCSFTYIFWLAKRFNSLEVKMFIQLNCISYHVALFFNPVPGGTCSSCFKMFSCLNMPGSNNSSSSGSVEAW